MVGEDVSVDVGCEQASPEAASVRQLFGGFLVRKWRESADHKLEFRVFMRRSEDLPENFSIGLAFLAKDGSGEVVLLRCNGPHGGYNDSFDPDHPHWDYHVHRASAEMIEAGLRPEKAATINRDFASYEEAVQYFLRVTNITDARTYFADLAQGILPFPDEEPTQ